MLKINLLKLPLISLLLVTASFSSVYSQERCSTVPYMEKLKREGKVKQTNEQFEQWLEKKMQSRQQQAQSQRTAGGPYEIPVVVHVIHNGEAVGTGTNISDAQILSQIEVLNKDFNRLNTDASNTPAEFLPITGSMDIEFVMARSDPNGDYTTGINRVQGTQTSWTMNDEAVFKALSYWASEDYMNIWVIKFSGNFIGYAQFPVSNLNGLEDYQNGIATTDGIVIDHSAFGTIDAGPFILDPDYNKGRTTTHEVGHFFGLRHIWGDVDSCSGSDYVADTPNQTTSTTGCPAHPQLSCSTTKMFQNFLDYTDDRCMNLFTQGQASRMMIILDDDEVPRRKSLLSSSGLQNPGCTTKDVELVKIESPGAVACDANTNFAISIRNRGCFPVNSITVDYSINLGATQAVTISLSTPLNINNVTTIDVTPITFQEGINIYSLNITQVNGSPDENLSNGSVSGQLLIDNSIDRIPLRETFNNLVWPTISPQGGINWELEPTNFGTSASVQAFEAGTSGTESWLVTPVLDFSSTTTASMFFDLSYAYNGIDFDRLRILGSTDCGATYISS
ncbi:MAG: zinc metalloprotease, partial [Cyclobacteriaceae bacterium]|nr:zinc metalloprotease [Cyclobacteriaceae bacterium]